MTKSQRRKLRKTARAKGIDYALRMATREENKSLKSLSTFLPGYEPDRRR